MCCSDGGGSSSAPQPDPQIGEAAKMSAQTGQAALDWAIKAYNEQAPARQKTAEVANQSAEQDMALKDKAMQQADEYEQYRQSTFQPIEKSLAWSSMGLTPEEVGQLQGMWQQEQDARAAAIKANAPLTAEQAGLAAAPTREQLYAQFLPQYTTTEQFALQPAQQFQTTTIHSGNFNAEGGDDRVTVLTPGQQQGVLTSGLKQFNPKLYAALAAGENGTPEQQSLARQYYDGAAPWEQQQGSALQSRTKIDNEGLNSAVDSAYQKAMADRDAQLAAINKGRGGAVPTDSQFASTFEQKVYELQQAAQQREMETQANRIAADTNAAAGQQRAAIQRAMQRYDPTGGKYLSAVTDTSMATTVGSADAQNKARQAAKQLGWAKMMDSAGLGRGLPGNQATQTGLALNAGGNAVNTMNAANANARADTGGVMQGYGTAMSGYGQQGNMLSQQYGQRLNAWNAQNQASAQESAGVGQFLGTVAAAAIPLMSDRRLKRDVRIVGRLPSGLNLYAFEYVWGGGTQVGVMADEVAGVFPDAVLDGPFGYKMVDYARIG